MHIGTRDFHCEIKTASTSKQANVVYSVEEVAAMFNNSSKSIISDVDREVSGMSSGEEFDLDEELLRGGESCEETIKVSNM